MSSSDISSASDACARAHLQDIALQLIATPEADYLSQFVRVAGEVIGAQLVLVSRIFGRDAPVTAYAIYDSSGQATEYEHPLSGTPCEQVFDGLKPFIRTEGLKSCFPEDTDLQAFDLDAYVGMPLNHENGECFGLIAALWSAPPTHPEAVLKIFEAVEPRLIAGVELIDKQRQETQRLASELEVISNRMEVAVKSSEIGIWEYDIEQQSMDWDDRMHALYGRTPGTIVAYSDWTNAVHPDDRARAESDVETALDRRTDFHSEFRIIRPDGEVRHIRASGRPITLSPNMSRLIGCNIDITEDVLKNQELVEKREAADAANVAKSQFLANMSHEIRTPLNGVLGMAQLLSRTDLSERQSRFLTTILSSGETLLSLIDDVLDLSRIESAALTLNPQPFSLEELLNSTIAATSGLAAEKGLALNLKLGNGLDGYRLGDAKRLRQIIYNLLGNGVKFTDSGEVRLVVNPADGDRVRFDVVDTGIGVPEHAEDLLFHRFAQADTSNTREYGGAGLGLSISRELVELFGGEIGFTRNEDRGTTFWFIIPLPLAANPPEAACPDPATANRIAGLPGKEKTVLVAEDIEHNRDLLVEALTNEGYVVRTAENGAIALDIWRKDHLDAILLDLQMPVMSGEEVISAIRRSTGDNTDVPILAVTADAARATQERITAMGADEYFSKPVDLSTLLTTLESRLV